MVVRTVNIKYGELLKESAIIAFAIFAINLITGKDWYFATYSAIRANWLVIAVIYFIIVIYYNFLYIRMFLVNVIFSPLLIIYYPYVKFRIKQYLKDFEQNVPRATVVILGHSDCYNPMTWVSPDFTIDDLKVLVKHLRKTGSDFSFYLNAAVEDVHKIMNNKEIKEVYFFGHGTSHTFLLGAEEIYYCDFSDCDKYRKEFVHQVHCGTPDGKSLIEYVVPEQNRNKCFFFRKTINSYDIEREFKKLEAKTS